jgi:hypothetical protein
MRALLQRRVAFLAAVLACLLAACSFGPSATFRTTAGCGGTRQWSEEWAKANIKDLSWSGACKDGLAEGQGTLHARLKDGTDMRYTGTLNQGRFDGDGDFRTPNGWRRVGKFSYGSFWDGKFYRPDGKIVYDGLIVLEKIMRNGVEVSSFENQLYHMGALHLNDAADTVIRNGRFDGSAGMFKGTGGVDLATGRGIVWGEVWQRGELVSRWVQGRQYTDTIAAMSAMTEINLREAAMAREQLAALQARNEREQALAEEQRAREMRAAVANLQATANIYAQRQGGAPTATVSAAPAAAARSSAAGGAGSQASANPAAPSGPGGRPAKRTHVPESVAHQCLQLQPGGGTRNSCAFAVEYSYCVLNPQAGSNSASFDCEGRSPGSWQVGPGSTAIMHSAGERVFIYACRYGSSLSTPDGISPAGIRYVAGQGLVGRCAEWGAG